MRKKFWLFAVLAIAAISVLVVWSQRDLDSGTDTVVDDEPTIVPVRVIEPSEMTLSDERSYSTVLQPWERAQVNGLSGTIIESIHVGEGDKVRRGQLVAQMDDAELRQAKVELQSAKNELERTKRLVDVGSVPGQKLEQLEAQYQTASNRVEMLRKNTRLNAPIDGVVTDKFFVSGEQFIADAETPAMLVIQQIDPLKAVVDISERLYRFVEPGDEVQLHLDAHGERDFDAVIHRIHPTVNPESRTFRAELRVENDDDLLRPGMSGHAAVTVGEISGLFVPRTALHTPPGSDAHFVYVVEDGTAHRLEVTTGEQVNAYRHIVDGLDDDAKVILEGTGRLSDKTPVRVVD